jgi:hypothetical protein
MDFFAQIPQMILDITRRDVGIRLNFLEELLEDGLGRFLEHTVQSI